MLLSLEKRFIFIHIPKTAGTSITDLLKPYAVIPKPSLHRRVLSHIAVPEAPEKAWLRIHDRASWLRRKLPTDIFETFHKFAVIRNPFDYAVSYYSFVRVNEGSKRHRFARTRSFSDFLRYLERKNRVTGVTQSSWVTDRKGSFLVDELLRFEKLDTQLPRLLDELCIETDGPLRQLNVSPRRDYRDYYSPDDRARAERLFGEDLERFGYRF